MVSKPERWLWGAWAVICAAFLAVLWFAEQAGGR